MTNQPAPRTPCPSGRHHSHRMQSCAEYEQWREEILAAISPTPHAAIVVDQTMNTCPRCDGPVAQFPGDIGARSRVTLGRDMAICGPCALDEATRDASGLAPIPPDEWPSQPRA